MPVLVAIQEVKSKDSNCIHTTDGKFASFCFGLNNMRKCGKQSNFGTLYSENMFSEICIISY